MSQLSCFLIFFNIFKYLKNILLYIIHLYSQ